MKIRLIVLALVALVLALAATPASAATGNPSSLSQVEAVFGPANSTHIVKANTYSDITCLPTDYYKTNLYVFWPDGSGYATPYTDSNGDTWFWRDNWANGVKVTTWHRVRNYTTKDVLVGVWCVH